MNTPWRFLLSLLLLLNGLAFLSAQDLLEQDDEALRLELIVTKDPSGQGIPLYHPGDALRIGVLVSQDAYVYLFEVDNGELIAIHPNQYDDEQHKFFRANELYTIPPAGADYEFILNELEARRRLVGLATPMPLAPAILQGFKEVNDLKGGIWALDEVLFAVGEDDAGESLADLPAQVTVSTSQRKTQQNSPSQADKVVAGSPDIEEPQLITPILPQEPAEPLALEGEVTGNFRISSIPEGAEVFVDNTRMGITPLVTNVDAGVRNVVLRLLGYKEVRFALEIRPKQDSVVETYLVKDDTIIDVPDAITADNTTISAPVDAEPVEPSAPATPPQANTPPNLPSLSLPSVEANRVHVTIRTNISEAEVFLDGNPVGRTNNIGELQLNNLFVGERAIAIRAEGFESLDTRQYLTAGEQILNLPLTPLGSNTSTQPSSPAPSTPSTPTPSTPSTNANANNTSNFTTTPVATAPTTPTTSNDTPTGNDLTGLEGFASPSFGLRNYPEARLLNIVESASRADSFIEIGVPAANLYAFFEQQLVSYGWQTNGLNETNNTIMGDFVGEGYKLRLEVTYISGNLYRLSVYNY